MSTYFTRRRGRLVALLVLSLAAITGIGLTNRPHREGGMSSAYTVLPHAD
jgi:hypothetical protein